MKRAFTISSSFVLLLTAMLFNGCVKQRSEVAPFKSSVPTFFAIEYAWLPSAFANNNNGNGQAAYNRAAQPFTEVGSFLSFMELPNRAVLENGEAKWEKEGNSCVYTPTRLGNNSYNFVYNWTKNGDAVYTIEGNEDLLGYSGNLEVINHNENKRYNCSWIQDNDFALSLQLEIFVSGVYIVGFEATYYKDSSGELTYFENGYRREEISWNGNGNGTTLVLNNFGSVLNTYYW